MKDQELAFAEEVKPNIPEDIDVEGDSDTSEEVELAEPTFKEAKLVATPYMNPIIWKQMKGMAATFIESKALPNHIQNAAQAVMVMQAGLEMDMKPIESLQSLYIVNGAINIWGKATMRRLREHGYTIKYENETSASCTATVTKKDREGNILEEYTETFKFSDAEKSGWTKTKYGELKVGWQEGQNRKLKLRYGVLSSLIKSYIPEVLGSAEEVAEVGVDYQVINLSEDKRKEEKTPKEKSKQVGEFLNKQKNS